MGLDFCLNLVTVTCEGQEDIERIPSMLAGTCLLKPRTGGPCIALSSKLSRSSLLDGLITLTVHGSDALVAECAMRMAT